MEKRISPILDQCRQSEHRVKYGRFVLATVVDVDMTLRVRCEQFHGALTRFPPEFAGG